MAGALRMATAAALGVIASLALWFSAHVLFARTHSIETPWGRAIAAPALESFDLGAGLIALACAFALVRLKTGPLLVVAAAEGRRSCASGRLSLPSGATPV